MKKILLDSNKKYFKANLHCHSTVSDGSKTPEQLKEMYKEQGYSAIAYTDHDILLDHKDLCDDSFIALNGFEMEINESSPISLSKAKTCHLCFIALKQDNLKQFCYHRTEYLFGNAPSHRHLIQFDENEPDYVRSYTPECINDMIKKGRDNGFFVTYNHPSWSLETLDDYGKYKGMNAMEICNYGCLENGFADYNEKEYDEMLRGGEKIFCTATDDNHNCRKDSFGGFTLINAEKLEYNMLTEALVRGEFYASQGPEIYELWFENGKIGIKCQNAAKIAINTGRRRADAVYGTTENPLTEAIFDVFAEDEYVRLTVTDFSGKPANTNAYFVNELLSD